MKEITDTPYYSQKLGNLPKGCQMCVKGEKLVLYITGICPRKCWFCPLSENRKDKDVIYVNEWKTNSKENLINEVKISQAKGTGITGGDPLSKLERTIEYIKLLKKEFGKEFHIHLYTSFNLVTEDSLNQLQKAGLDEIRFHPDLDDEILWNKIDIANKFNWDIGIEIPCIPDKEKEIKKLCNYFNNKIQFLNLNEFEISELNSEEMYKHNFNEKSDISHGIKGSGELGNTILNYVLKEQLNFNVHYCTSKLKDKVQMQNRFKLRAQNVKTEFDIINSEGLLIRGCIYLKDFLPKDKKLNNYNKEDIINKLQEKKEFLEEEGLEIYLDEKKLRLITYPEHVNQFAKILKKIDLIPAIIEEDPTVEAFEVNIDWL